MENSFCRVGFLLIDGFSMIAFANVLEPLRMANYIEGKSLYHWRLAGLTGNQTAASNGVKVGHTHMQHELTVCDIVFVCGGYDVRHLVSPILRQLLQQLAARDIILGGICTGAFALADAGLLDGCQVSLHWENHLAAKEHYPEVIFNEHIYTLDHKRYTCSGGTAGLDMALQMIRERHGKRLAGEIAELFLIDHWRQSDSYQHLPKPERISPGYEYVINAIGLMQSNLEEPLTQKDLSRLAGISSRQLQRLFQQYCGAAPSRYYLEMRLRRARELLQQTSMNITDIALACGFLTVSSLSKAYRRHYGCPPSQERRKFRPQPNFIA